MKLHMKESNGGVETIRYGADDLKGLNKYRVDLYKPNSDWTALIKRTYVYAKDENDARTQLFNDIPNDVKRKYGFTDVEVAPIEVNKVKESLNMREARNARQKEVYVVQEYVPGYGWEDVCTYDDTSSKSLADAKADVRSYRENGYVAKLITRRIDNPNYIEPTNNITYAEVVDWVENCPYDVEEDYLRGGKNYSLKNPSSITWNCVQIFADEDDDTVRVRNCQTNRTKQVYSIDELEKQVVKILGK